MPKAMKKQKIGAGAASWSSRPCAIAGASSHIFIRTFQHEGQPHPVLSRPTTRQHRRDLANRSARHRLAHAEVRWKQVKKRDCHGSVRQRISPIMQPGKGESEGIKPGVKPQKACQNFQLLAVRLAGAVFPCSNQCRCNTHFRRQVTGRQVFLHPFDLNPIANRLYARWQRFRSLLFS